MTNTSLKTHWVIMISSLSGLLETPLLLFDAFRCLGINWFWPKWHWPKWVLAQVALAKTGLDEMGLAEVAIPHFVYPWRLYRFIQYPKALQPKDKIIKCLPPSVGAKSVVTPVLREAFVLILFYWWKFVIKFVTDQSSCNYVCFVTLSFHLSNIWLSPFFVKQLLTQNAYILHI